jgi:hypothetical protein
MTEHNEEQNTETINSENLKEVMRLSDILCN